ncbi:hypothetical protein PHYSODRAFT_297787 [Phytophthora sojae]|uniref:Uncharacterized protein n=1 Tax=Phytophthora sojae (strain P6497) TaxID=1094619 RepID=G4Z9K7_PHYSP|nr:hypothetical protein PHYSODRAFT_297787 [Phytophthora sojae]EGZ19121.1 hypothetical protein PHYSODRAFT_297787 [Phytophthora sojae]|eukprot:XP_009521838.1 hypothetical protein PHYSODRAFT_297787 [Phytophthora sojae]
MDGNHTLLGARSTVQHEIKKDIHLRVDPSCSAPRKLWLLCTHALRWHFELFTFEFDRNYSPNPLNSTNINSPLSPSMKTSSSILAAMALLAVAALGANGVHVDDNPIAHHAHASDHLVTSEPVADERTWVPFRALRSMDYPQLGHLSDYTHKPRTPTSLDKLTAIKNAHRALGQAQATPAPTVPVTKATPAPTKTDSNNVRATPAPTKANPPRATPASTTTSATPRPTTTSSTHHVAPPPANKKPKAPAAPPTKQGKTGPSSTSNATQQKTRNLGGNEAKQQLPSDHHHGAKQGVKNGLKHH